MMHQATLRYSRLTEPQEQPHYHQPLRQTTSSPGTRSSPHLYHHKQKEASPRPPSSGRDGAYPRREVSSDQKRSGDRSPPHSYSNGSSERRRLSYDTQRVKDGKRERVVDGRERGIDVGRNSPQRHSSMVRNMRV